jgi:uncharacterized membrane protein
MWSLFGASWLERIWLSAHPTKDSRRKSLFKAISRRIVGTLDTILLSRILTWRLKVAISIGGVEIITKTILYYYHERAWARVQPSKKSQKTVN